MEDEGRNQPLLLHDNHRNGEENSAKLASPKPGTRSFSSFAADEDDIPPITGAGEFARQFWVETKKLWFLAGPAIFCQLCQYSLGAITQVFAGHVSAIALATFAFENLVIAGFSYGVMLGMGSALETLCGQAYGAGQVDMLGVYMQRSWVILYSSALLLTLLYVFSGPLLRLIGQKAAIAEAVGTFAIWMIPQMFAYAFNFPIAKFLQSQSKILAMAVISTVALALHTAFSWILILKLGWGLVGAAVVLDSSWWFIVVAQMGYIFCGSCGRAWSGFSLEAFHNLWGFVRLSLASAVMLCLEVWYYVVLILFAGYLENAEVSIDAFSICVNVLGWVMMVAIGFNAAVSVRVSNELGAAHPRTAKFSVVVAIVNSFAVGLLLAAILLIFRSRYSALFSSSSDVKELVYELTPLLALTIVIDCVQPVLSGVAVGAGWQALVAYVNIGSYYVFGIPLGLILGYKLGFGVKGIWYGMVSGTIVQTCIIFVMVYKTNWNKEASVAGDRIRQWGGPSSEDVQHVDSTER